VAIIRRFLRLTLRAAYGRSISLPAKLSNGGILPYTTNNTNKKTAIKAVYLFEWWAVGGSNARPPD